MSHNLDDAIAGRGREAEGALTTHPQPETLTAYHQGTLDEAARDDLQAHLAVCSECTALLLDLIEMCDGAAETDEASTSDAWDDFAVQLRREPGFVATPTPHDGAAPQDAKTPPPPSTSSPWASWAAAAVFFFATVGLGLWGLRMHHELDTMRSPQLNVPIVDLEGDAFRSADRPISVQLGAGRDVVVILNPATPARQAVDVRIVDLDGREIWRGSGLEPTPFGNFTLGLSRPGLPSTELRIELLQTSTPHNVLESFSLDLTP